MIKVGLLGHPVSHSLSPVLHSAAFEYTGIAGHYELLDTQSEDLKNQIEFCRQAGFRGVNVTIPHKESALSHCTVVDETARAVGAANTIVFKKNGDVLGANTDVLGFTRSLQEDLNFCMADRNVLVVGAGGAARAVIVAAHRARAASVTVTNRSSERLHAITNDFDVATVALDWTALKTLKNVDLVVNATACGMGGELSEVSVRQARSFFELVPFSEWDSPVAYDLIYTPTQTAFMATAQDSGLRAVGGLGMLVYQAALAFELWTEHAADEVIGAMSHAVQTRI